MPGSRGSRGKNRPARRIAARPRGNRDFFAGACTLHRQQHRAAPFAADADPLDEAQYDQHDRAPDADLLISGDASDKEGRQAGQQQGRDQRGFAADSIAVMAKIAAPIGRATKPTAKTANACKVPVKGSDDGKYNLAKTSAAIWPYSRKSYYSIVVPTVLAITARLSWAR